MSTKRKERDLELKIVKRIKRVSGQRARLVKMLRLFIEQTIGSRSNISESIKNTLAFRAEIYLKKEKLWNLFR